MTGRLHPEPRWALALSFFLALLLGARSAGAAPVPVNERMYVPIGGIEQWITIKGQDRANPVLLVLHGGPGNAWSPFADAMFAGWDKDFTLVQWDQRGAGRTFGKSGPSASGTMTVERMVSDGIEVASYLRTHLGQARIILVGGSWGSTLGLQMVHARPDLFHAIVAFAPVVNMKASMIAGYNKVLQMAKADRDEAAVAALTAIGSPPWASLKTWPLYRKWLRTYQAKIVTAASAPRQVSPDYASAEDEKLNEDADEFSFVQFWGMTLSGPLMQIDLASLGKSYKVPVYLVAGAADLTAPPELAKAFFDGISAPDKQFHLVDGTGHEPSVPELGMVRKILTDVVKPRAMAPQ
jgi:pimeloyl-ACP methyl ester carboxylesterase